MGTEEEENEEGGKEDSTDNEKMEIETNKAWNESGSEEWNKINVRKMMETLGIKKRKGNFNMWSKWHESNLKQMMIQFNSPTLKWRFSNK